jgi:uncharacterized protein
VTPAPVGRPVEHLSEDEARRVTLAAQGFGERPNRVDVRPVRRTINRVGVLQLDSVNVLCRSHYLPLFARLGPYPRTLLDRLVWGGERRELFEYWGHKASLMPLETYPLMRWRMDAAVRQVWGSDLRRWRTWLDPALLLAPWAVIEGMTRVAHERPTLVDEVLEVVVSDGPMTAGEVTGPKERHLKHGGLWNWHDAKIALEWLFYAGKVAITGRRNFERVYDLTERVIPAATLDAPTPSPVDAQRELLRIAARAQGIASEKQLLGYFRLPAELCASLTAELVDAGELVPTLVGNDPKPMFLWKGAPVPRAVDSRALLSPFDSLIWDRDRTERLFQFHYRISIYTPEAKRTHGYYVLPFLLGDRLVARVDLKADRRESTLRVMAAYAEPDVERKTVSRELSEELRSMAGWLELDRVAVHRQGDLATALSRNMSS